MTEQEFEVAFELARLDSEYAQYIMDNSGGDRLICNGDTLIEAMEDFYLYDSFKDSMVTK